MRRATSEKHAQNGLGIKLAAGRSGMVLAFVAARVRALCAFREHAQNRHPVGGYVPSLFGGTRSALCAMGFGLVLLNGCARAPAIDVLGSFFPIWIFCILAGIVLTVIAHQVVVRLSPDADYGSPVLIYPSLVVLFACLTWLLFFR